MAKIQIKNSFITSSGQITISSSFVRFQDRVQAKNLTGSLSGTASYASKTLTASYALNASSGGGGSVQTGSIAKQTILYNFKPSDQATITGLNLTNNKWGVSIVEEWDQNIIPGDLELRSIDGKIGTKEIHFTQTSFYRCQQGGYRASREEERRQAEVCQSQTQAASSKSSAYGRR